MAHIVDSHDIRIGEHCDRVGLRAEGAAELLIRGHFIAHDFDGDAAVETQILPLVYDGHTALSDQLLNHIAIVEDPADILVLVVHKDLRSRAFSA